MDGRTRWRAGLAGCVLASTAVGAPAAQCEAASPEPFAAFIERFSTQKAFSLARTQLPLRTLRWQYGDDAPTPVHGRAERAELARQPTLASHLQQNGLRGETDRVQAGAARYKVFKPDTDWQMVYHFRLHGNCWWLELFEDESL